MFLNQRSVEFSFLYTTRSSLDLTFKQTVNMGCPDAQMTFPRIYSNFPLTCKYCIPYTMRHRLCVGWCLAMSLDVLENLRLELRRGCLVLAVLVELRSEYHGYALGKALTESGINIDESTLYPLLRRLESQKLLVSDWRVEDKRNKRFYRLSEEGQQVLERLLVEWRNINGSIEKLLEALLPVGRREA